MVDHEGKVKEIEWRFDAGDIFPTVHEYSKESAPARLMPRGPHPDVTSPACAAAVAAAGVPTLTALEAGLALVLVGALLAFLYSLLSFKRPPQPDTPATADEPSAQLVVADLARWPQPLGAGGPSCSNSSYVTKVEAFLRFAGIQYSKQVGFPDAAAAPKAQLPFIERGGQRIGDSTFIIKHLVSSGAAPAELEAPPGAHNKAAALAVSRMCDTDLATAIAYARWVDDAGWVRCRRALLGPYRLPLGVSTVVSRMARKACLTRVVEQGFGRHSEGDREALVKDELAALADLLGDRQFLFGDSPHAVDASAFGVLDQMAAGDFNPGLAKLLAAHPTLVAFRERIRTSYFGAAYEKEVVWLDGPMAQRGAVEEGQGSGAAGAAEGKRRKEE